MAYNRHSSPITIFDEDSITESDTDAPASSGVEWLGPENQLGLELEDQFGVEQNEVNVDGEKGEIKP